MIVDVIIPTYKPDHKFDLLIQRLNKQKHPIRKIIVLNTKTGRFPEELINDYDNITVKHLQPQQFDHGATRAMGADLSDADIIIFMTQDAVPANNMLITKLVEPFHNSRIAISYARQLPDKHCRTIERFTREFNYPKESKRKSKLDLETLGIKTIFCSNVCAAYRNSIYKSLDGFPERAIFNEDMIMAWKVIQAGYHIMYKADAEVIHSHNYSGSQQFKRNFDLAVSQQDHLDIFGGIDSREEGIRLVRKTATYLCQIKRPWLILSLIWSSGCKYAGYRLGRKYRKLPSWLVKKCTMNPRYWADW